MFLLNPSFELGTLGPTSASNLAVIPTPVDGTGWAGWNNTAVLTTMELLPTTLPLASAGNLMLHIQTAGDQNGIYQFFGGGSYYSGAWIYALAGSALVGVVPGTYATSTLLNQWEFVGFATPVGGNEVIIYSNGVNGADFYVDLAVVDSNQIIPESLTPEPSSLGLLALGAASIFAGRGFRKRS